MAQRTMGAICLGPTDNRQGGHWLLSLTSGSRVRRNCCTPMPMPQEVLARVNTIGLRQKMPTKITYSNRYGNEIEDIVEDVGREYDSDDDSLYASSDNEDSSDSEYDSDDYDYDDDGLDDHGNNNNENNNIPPTNELDDNQEINVGEPYIVDELASSTPPRTRTVSIPIIPTPARIANRPTT